MKRDVIDIEFTPEERKLILRYGYPFEGIQQAFQACQASNQVETIPVEAFELERLIGDLCISINEAKGGPVVQGQLLDLCDRLEAAQRYGEGQLDAP